MKFNNQIRFKYVGFILVIEAFFLLNFTLFKMAQSLNEIMFFLLGVLSTIILYLGMDALMREKKDE